MSWTDERVELLKKLWADGLSASQIAGELGGITRNAVIGKVHRLGPSGRPKAPSSSVPLPAHRRVRQVPPARPARPPKAPPLCGPARAKAARALHVPLPAPDDARQ